MIKNFVLSLIVCAGVVSAVNYASADETPAIAEHLASAPDIVHRDITPDNAERVLVAQADTGSAAAPSSPADPGSASAGAASESKPKAAGEQGPEISDIGVMTKLWKSGAFFGFGIMAAFVVLVALDKLDKKRAFYYATGLGGIGILVESIRKGDTPSVVTVVNTLLPTLALLIAGPNHVKAPTPS